MLAYDRHHGVVSIFSRPVALPFQHDLLPGYRNDAYLDHALHGIVMRVFRRTAGGVGYHVDLVSTLQHRTHSCHPTNSWRFARAIFGSEKHRVTQDTYSRRSSLTRRL